jgi:hypothetical protein
MTLEECARTLVILGPSAHNIAKDCSPLLTEHPRSPTIVESLFTAAFHKILQDCLIVIAFYEDLFQAGVMPTESQAKALQEMETWCRTNGYWKEGENK